MTTLPQRILGDLRPYRRLVLGLVGSTLVYATARIIPPLAARVLLDHSLAARPAVMLGVSLSPGAVLTVVPALLLALAATLAGAQYAIRLWSGILGQRFVGGLQVRLLEHLLRMPVSVLERTTLGSQLIRFNSDMSAVKRFVSRSVPELGRDAMAIVVIAAALVILHRPLAYAVVVIIVAYVILAGVWWRRLDAAGRALRSARRRISGLAYDRLVVLPQVKLTGRERREARRMRGVQREVLSRSRTVAALGGWMSGSAELAVGIMVAASLGLGARSVLAATMSRGEMVAFYGLILMLLGPMRTIGRTLEALALGRVAFDRLYRVLDAPEERDGRGALPLCVVRGEMRFTGVRIRARTFPDLLIPPGVTVMTGRPGDGLSALGQLLVRLRQASAGDVCIDGIPVSAVQLRSLRRQVVYIPAAAPLLKGTLRMNVLAGSGTSAEAAALSALRAVGATWADSGTLRAPVGTGGRRLSPVQRWHVLCARAVAARPAIVILDGVPASGRAVDEAINGFRSAGVRSVLVLTEHALPEVRETTALTLAAMERVLA
jgi:ABC-type multidrug transport system fused ATPase/permease subunit